MHIPENAHTTHALRGHVQRVSASTSFSLGIGHDPRVFYLPRPCVSILRKDAPLHTPIVKMHADRIAKVLVVLGCWSLPLSLHHSFQTACGALESSIFRRLDGAEGTAATPPTAESGAGGRGRRAAAQHATEAATESSGVAVDLDAAVAFSR